MENPNIIISIDQGPQKGQTLERSHGSVIRIGRVVRGNTIAIKDPGISQKHITVEFHREISRWAVTDLGTSNGTTVNGMVISPNAPFPLTNGDNIRIGENTFMSVKISASTLAPEPRRRRGRRIAAAAATPPTEEVEDEKVPAPEKHEIPDDFQGKICSESANIDEAMGQIHKKGTKGRPRRGCTEACSSRSPMEHKDSDVKENADELNKNRHKRRAQQKRSIISAATSGNKKALETVVEEGDCRDTENSAVVLKENDEEREVRHEKVNGPTKDGGKGRGRAKKGVELTSVLRKDAPSGSVILEQKMERVVKALSMPCSAMVMIVKEEDEKDLEKIGELVREGGEGRAHTKRGGRAAKVSRKDEVLEPVVLPPGRGRVTRASIMAMNSSALVEKKHKREDEKINEEKVVETYKNRGKHRERFKKGGRSTIITTKGEALESKIEEKIEGSLTGTLDATVAKSARDIKGVQKNKVSFVVKEAENHKDAAMCGDSNKTDDLHFFNKTELVYSWSSFSEIRGIPNTTSKYREDRMINCHATPFEERIERALNRGIADTSSSAEI